MNPLFTARAMFLLRILIASLAITASLQAGDHGFADSSTLATTSNSQEKTLANKSESTPENDVVSSSNDPGKAHSSKSVTPSTAADGGSSIAADFPQESTSRNPWLYIIIGFLLVTGALLYVDPRIF